jgi:hypothetical protein
MHPTAAIATKIVFEQKHALNLILNIFQSPLLLTYYQNKHMLLIAMDANQLYEKNYRDYAL